MENKKLPFHQGEIIWLKPFYQMGIETHQGIQIPYTNGIPGQTIKCRLKKTAKNHYDIIKVKFTSKSEVFKKPECEYFTECGGCQWLHVNYQTTLSWKNERIKHLLHKNNIHNYTFLPIEENENPFNIRYKAIFPVQQTTNFKIGLYKHNSHEIVDIENCLMVQPEFNLIINIVRSWMKENNIQGYNENKNTGLVRHLLMQKSHSLKNVSLTLISTSFNIPKLQKLIKMIKDTLPEISGINIMKNNLPGNTIVTHEVKCVFGKSYIQEKISDINIKIYPQSFFQVNIPMAIKLFTELNLQIQNIKISNIIEFYAGTGIIGLLLNKNVNSIFAFEFNKNAVLTGENAIRENNIKNFKIHRANLEEESFLSELKKHIHLDDKSAIIADPPRKGLSSHIHSLLEKISINHFIYISCNSDTFFRDASKMQKIGFKLKWLKPYDFFPFTPHIELLGVFEKKREFVN